MKVTVPLSSRGTRRNFTLLALFVENMTIYAFDMTVFAIFVVDIARQTLTCVVGLLDKHVLPTLGQYPLTLLS